MMAGLSPSLLQQLEAAGFYVFRDPPPTGAVGPLKVRPGRTPTVGNEPSVPERPSGDAAPSRPDRADHA